MNIPSQDILLTGATGFLGYRTLERLVKVKGKHTIIATGRTLRQEAWITHDRVQYVLGDLADREYVIRLFEENHIGQIIHCAALSSPWGSEDAFFRANVLPQQHLIEQASKQKIEKFVFVSTPTVYVNHRDRLGIKESDPLPPRLVNAYARSKRQAEQLLEESKLPWIILRPRALIGRGDRVIMPRIMRAYHEKRLKIMGHGNNIVDLTPVSNVVDAILLALSADVAAHHRIYNLSNGQPVPLWDTIAYTMKQLGFPPLTQKVPYRLVFFIAWLMEGYARYFNQGKEPVLTRYSVSSMARSLSLDISQAKQYLGYEPRQSVREAIDEFVEWFQSTSVL